MGDSDKHTELETLKNEFKAAEEELNELNEKVKTEAADKIESLKETIKEKTQQKEDMSEKIKRLEEDCKDITGSAYDRTTDAIGSAKDRVAEKFDDIKNSETVKTIGDKIEGAYTSVKETIMGKSDGTS